MYGFDSASARVVDKLARISYHVLKERTPFNPLSDEAYERQVRGREVANLKKKAAKLGLTVVAAAA
jgi:hypothetical protein